MMRFTLTWASLKESYELRPLRSVQRKTEPTYLGLPRVFETDSRHAAGHHKFV
jgi:hypothetical protein